MAGGSKDAKRERPLETVKGLCLPHRRSHYTRLI